MSAAEEALLLLKDAAREYGEIETPEEWIFARMPDSLQVVEATMGLQFSRAPTAAALAGALTEVDREARRTATAIERRVPPRTLYGRGVRLVRPADGLIVAEAHTGSLDVICLLGAVYSAVVSQPLSFVLNVASLLHYGKVAVRAVLPTGRQRAAQLSVAPTIQENVPSREPFGDALEIPTEHGLVRIPAGFEYVRFKLKAADGSELEFEAGPHDPR